MAARMQGDYVLVPMLNKRVDSAANAAGATCLIPTSDGLVVQWSNGPMLRRAASTKRC